MAAACSLPNFTAERVIGGNYMASSLLGGRAATQKRRLVQGVVLPNLRCEVLELVNCLAGVCFDPV